MGASSQFASGLTDDSGNMQIALMNKQQNKTRAVNARDDLEREVFPGVYVGKFPTGTPKARTKGTNRVLGLFCRGVAMLVAAGVAAALVAITLGNLDGASKGDPPPGPQLVDAQRAQGPRLSIVPTIVAVSSSQTPLHILMASRDEIPANSFLNISGLPPAILLSAGRAIGPGEWIVPFSSLSGVMMNVPAGMTGTFELVVTLLTGGDEARPTPSAQTRATLVIAPLGASVALGNEASGVLTPENHEGRADAPLQPSPTEARTAAAPGPSRANITAALGESDPLSSTIGRPGVSGISGEVPSGAPVKDTHQNSRAAPARDPTADGRTALATAPEPPRVSANTAPVELHRPVIRPAGAYVAPGEVGLATDPHQSRIGIPLQPSHPGATGALLTTPEVPQADANAVTVASPLHRLVGPTGASVTTGAVVSGNLTTDSHQNGTVAPPQSPPDAATTASAAEPEPPGVSGPHNPGERPDRGGEWSPLVSYVGKRAGGIAPRPSLATKTALAPTQDSQDGSAIPTLADVQPNPVGGVHLDQSGESTPRQGPTVTPEERTRAESLVTHGERYLADGNVGLARQFFQRAAEAGIARGALLLGATYDPRELASLHVLGNPAVARKWYERARALGAPESEEARKATAKLTPQAVPATGSSSLESGSTAPIQCIKAGGWGTGALQGFATYMAEAAMQDSAKAKFGQTVKIGSPTTKCETKGLLYECTAYARACR